jgi:hypothetical protein
MVREKSSSLSGRCGKALCIFRELMECVCSGLNDPGNAAANLQTSKDTTQ